ncbi:MAG: hypothetical protein J7L38_01390 [Thermoproteales archaeon]|nr:hypothetical protein [Thermoproteales archaeon]
MEVEVEELHTPWGVKENVKLTFKGTGSLSFRSGLYPGLVDSHAHPHVIDGGLEEGRKWSNYIEWFEKRRLLVNESTLRRDLELCTALSKLTLMLSALEGTTLIALTGNYKANIRAATELKNRPRVVTMPTIINKNGWDPLEIVAPIIKQLENFDANDMLGVGIFCHSLRYTSEKYIRTCVQLCDTNNMLLGIHLSEGIPELDVLRRILLKPPKTSIIGVHCIEDEDYETFNIRTVQCASSNLALYGRTQRELGKVYAFGSDWPLLFGSMVNELKVLIDIHSEKKIDDIILRATINGYRLFKVDFRGDYVFFDDKLEKALSAGKRPSYVFVKGYPLVREGKVNGYTYDEILSMISQVREEAIKRHGIWGEGDGKGDGPSSGLRIPIHASNS